MIIGHWHTSWTVSDLERALVFYCEGLGFEVVHLQEQANEYTEQLVGLKGAHLKAALLAFPSQPKPLSGHVLELIEYVRPLGKRLDSPPNNIGAAHVALVTTDVAMMYKRMVNYGAVFISLPVAITAGINQGGSTCYMRDPDGFIVELMQPPAWRLEGKPRLSEG